MKLLFPVDGSDTSLRATDVLLKRLTWFASPVEIHLLNIQVALRKNVAQFVNHEELRKYHHDEGMAALAPVRAKLDAAGVPYSVHVVVGDQPAATIVQYANEKSMDEIFMGTHGRSGLTHLLLGSVAQGVVQDAKVPVTLVN